MNWYNYVGGDPANNTYPSGLAGGFGMGNCFTFLPYAPRAMVVARPKASDIPVTSSYGVPYTIAVLRRSPYSISRHHGLARVEEAQGQDCRPLLPARVGLRQISMVLEPKCLHHSGPLNCNLEWMRCSACTGPRNQ